MPTIQETRIAEHKALHAPGKLTRLKVITKADFKELINGSPRIFTPGQVFDHPAPARAKQLLEIGGLVELTTEQTEEEKAKAVKTKAVMLDLAEKKLKDQAVKKVEEILAGMEKLKGALEKMPLDVLKAEAEKRGLKGLPENPDAVKTAILEDEQAKLEA